MLTQVFKAISNVGLLPEIQIISSCLQDISTKLFQTETKNATARRLNCYLLPRIASL